MRKNQQGFSLIGILLITILSVAIVGTGLYVYSRKTNIGKTTINTNQHTVAATKDQVTSAANDYLVSKVGSENANKYYALDKARSSYANPKDSEYDFIAYHFSPAKAITANDDVLMVQVNRNNLSQIYADAVPDCVKDKSFCDFNVSGDTAMAIARQYLKANDLVVSWGPSVNDKSLKGLGYVITVSSCSVNKTILIDYRDGKVIRTETGCGSLD